LSEAAFPGDQTFAGRIHDRVDHWLTQEGWSTRPLPGEASLWVLVASDRHGRRLVISQSRGHEDRVLIEGRVVPSEEQAAALEAMPEPEQQEIIWDTGMELLRLGIDYSGVDLPLKRIVLVESIYFEGALDNILAKDTFFQRIEQIRRGVAMVQLLLRRRLG
jgi:hypothetical protein